MFQANGSLIYVEGAKDIKMMEGSEKLCAPLEEHCTEATPLPSPLADTKVGSANIEDEVRDSLLTISLFLEVTFKKSTFSLSLHAYLLVK